LDAASAIPLVARRRGLRTAADHGSPRLIGRGPSAHRVAVYAAAFMAALRARNLLPGVAATGQGSSFEERVAPYAPLGPALTAAEHPPLDAGSGLQDSPASKARSGVDVAGARHRGPPRSSSNRWM
jgi:hypothetical protein